MSVQQSRDEKGLHIGSGVYVPWFFTGEIQLAIP